MERLQYLKDGVPAFLGVDYAGLRTLHHFGYQFHLGCHHVGLAVCQGLLLENRLERIPWDFPVEAAGAYGSGRDFARPLDHAE